MKRHHRSVACHARKNTPRVTKRWEHVTCGICRSHRHKPALVEQAWPVTETVIQLDDSLILVPWASK